MFIKSHDTEGDDRYYNNNDDDNDANVAVAVAVAAAVVVAAAVADDNDADDDDDDYDDDDDDDDALRKQQGELLAEHGDRGVHWEGKLQQRSSHFTIFSIGLKYDWKIGFKYV